MEKIQVQTFNPFVGRFPNDKVITHGTLALIKTLRDNGFIIEFLPADDRELKYLFRKGDFSLFQDPFILFLLGISTKVLINIITDFIKGRKKIKKRDVNVEMVINNSNVVINNITNNEFVSIDGSQIKPEVMATLKEKADKVANEFTQSTLLKSPYVELPTPIYLEHTSRIVGWAQISLDKVGIKIDKSKIEDDNTWNRLKNGELRGASVSGIADITICSICKSNYVNCNHISGQTYESVMCTNTIVKARLAEISLVDVPSNSECIIDILNNN